MLEDLQAHTNKELVGIYNGLNPDKPMKAWKGKKTVLIARIQVLREEVLDETTTGTSDDEVKEIPSSIPLELEVETPKPAGTIRALAIELLCRIEFHEDRNKKSGTLNRLEESAIETTEDVRSVGIPYDKIIPKIKKKFPECQTTVACLRWYAVKIRVEEQGYEGLRLPQRRPRAIPCKS